MFSGTESCAVTLHPRSQFKILLSRNVNATMIAAPKEQISYDSGKYQCRLRALQQL